MKRLIFLAFAVSVAFLGADPLRPIADAARDVYTPVALDEQRLAGMLASRLRANSEGYLEQVKVSELLEAFKARSSDPDQAQRAADERAPVGQAAGLFLEAAANTYEYTADGQIKSIMNRVAQGLIASQQSDGRLGAYAASGTWTPMDLSVHGTALLGLLSYSRVTGDEQAFATARRLADVLVKYALSARPQGSEDWGKGDLLGSMVTLYRGTGDARYFNFCKRLVQAASSNTAAPSNAIEQRDLYLYWAGLVDLYRLTGDQSYLAPAINGWLQVRDQALSITGSPIAVDSANNARESWTDSCLTVTWMELTLELLQLRGEAQYADAIETTIYNQLLSAQDPRTGKIDSCAAIGGTKKPEMKADTCTAAESLGLSTIPTAVWGRYGEGIGVNLYQPGHATVRLRRATVQLYSETDYPDSGNFLLHIEATHDVHFPLRLRVPSWTSKFTAQIGSSVATGKPGEYLVINREWKRGDTVKIAMDMPTKAIVNPANHGQVAIQRGPQVLVLANTVGAADSQGPTSMALSATPVDAQPAGRYSVAGRDGGSGQSLLLAPFADSLSYRLWMKAPEASH